MLSNRKNKVSDRKAHDPFGMLLVGRNYSITNENYRFGFNGYENTDEVLGDNTAIDFGARIYDCRIARFFSIDPWSGIYPWQSVYVYYSNCPIAVVDVNGMGGTETDTKDGKATQGDMQPGMTSEDNGNIIFNTTRDFEGKNWDYAVWNETSKWYDFYSYDASNYVKNNPKYQVGELWRTDTGEEGIWPLGSNPGRPGMTKIDVGTFSTASRTNMVDIINNHPNWVAFSMPRTQQMERMDEAFQDGAKDAAIFWVATFTAPFVVAEAAIFAPIAYEYVLTQTANGLAYIYVNVANAAYYSTTFGAASTYFGKSVGKFNSNNWVRAGWGWNGRTEVFRVAFGARGYNNATNVINYWGPTLYQFNYMGNFLFSQGHIDLFTK